MEMVNQILDPTLRKADIRKTFGRTAAGILIFFLLKFLLEGGIVSGYNFFLVFYDSSRDFLPPSVMTLLPYVVSFSIAALVLYLFLKKLPNADMGHVEGRRLSTLQFIKIFLVCFAFTVAASYLTTLFISTLMSITGLNELSSLFGGIEDTGFKPAYLIKIVVIAPIFEELVFRKLLYKKLIRFGPLVFVFTAPFFSLFLIFLWGSCFTLFRRFGFCLCNVLYKENFLFHCPAYGYEFNGWGHVKHFERF